jgi:hypothetical protein
MAREGEADHARGLTKPWRWMIVSADRPAAHSTNVLPSTSQAQACRQRGIEVLKAGHDHGVCFEESLEIGPLERNGGDGLRDAPVLLFVPRS